MNEWGVPDWRDASAYPDVTDWKRPRWVWEVVRRRADYRREAMSLLRRAETGFADDPHEAMREEIRAFNVHHMRWGYLELLDPRQSDYDDSLLLRSALVAGGISYMEWSPSVAEGRSSIAPRENQIAVLLNLEAPFTSQVRQVERLLRRKQIERQEKLHGKTDAKPLPPMPGANVISARSRHVWLRYLRVFDAIDAGAKPPEIGRTLNTSIHDNPESSGKELVRNAKSWGANMLKNLPILSE